jgi:hypothetical protein
MKNHNSHLVKARNGAGKSLWGNAKVQSYKTMAPKENNAAETHGDIICAFCKSQMLPQCCKANAVQ